MLTSRVIEILNASLLYPFSRNQVLNISLLAMTKKIEFVVQRRLIYDRGELSLFSSDSLPAISSSARADQALHMHTDSSLHNVM